MGIVCFGVVLMGYKQFGQQTFWDVSQGYRETKLDDLAGLIDFEIFRFKLESCFPPHRLGQSKYPPLFLFKVMLLQKWYGLSDEGVEAAIADRMSFKRFLGMSTTDSIPDSTTLVLFRKALREKGLMDELFALLDQYLREQGLLVNGGQMVDVTFVAAPKAKDGDKNWLDADADFGHKGHGYSMSTNVEQSSKLIAKVAMGSARPHDSQYLEAVLTGEETELWADSAFVHLVPELEARGIATHIHEKPYRNKPLNDVQKESNRIKSKTRARVEHPYAEIKCVQGFRIVRYLGIVANRADALLHSIAYNLKRLCFLQRAKACPA
jgi:IS5 family transposase